jgi:vacuolar protein sorting-associated protein 8
MHYFDKFHFSNKFRSKKKGMAFYHNLYKVVMVNATETTRILGRYPVPTPASQTPIASKLRRSSTVFGLAPLPLGQSPHGSEGFGLVAMLTPYKVFVLSSFGIMFTLNFY